jgi:hypothetical protein
MNVKELIELLRKEDPYAVVIVKSGKWGYNEVKGLEKGYWDEQCGDFDPDEEGFGEDEGTNNSIILE